jgi:hypothetical protein
MTGLSSSRKDGAAPGAPSISANPSANAIEAPNLGTHLPLGQPEGIDSTVFAAVSNLLSALIERSLQL